LTNLVAQLRFTTNYFSMSFAHHRKKKCSLSTMIRAVKFNRKRLGKSKAIDIPEPREVVEEVQVAPAETEAETQPTTTTTNDVITQETQETKEVKIVTAEEIPCDQTKRNTILLVDGDAADNWDDPNLLQFEIECDNDHFKDE